MDEVINHLTGVPLNTEPDVREEFLTPLLRLLGYRHEAGEIDRGRDLKTPFQSGTKKQSHIVPDYILAVGGRSYLVADAKTPSADPMQSLETVTSYGYISQVYSYAAHLEVQAPFFVVSNGTTTAVYRTTATNFDPLMIISQDVLAERFADLYELVSKRSLSKYQLARAESRWRKQIGGSEVGFQPMNLDVGDVNGDDVNEIVVAVSENAVRIVDATGYVTSVPTQGWVWWLRCTASVADGDAAIVGMEKDRGDAGQPGRILGLSSSEVLWELPLTISGSGFETLDKIAVNRERRHIVAANPVEGVLHCVSFAGEHHWSFAPSDHLDEARYVQHVVEASAGDTVITVGRERGNGEFTGYVARVSPEGQLRAAAETQFRPGAVALLSDNAYFVVEAVGSRFAIIDGASGEIVDTGTFSSKVPSVAVDTGAALVAVATLDSLRIYPFEMNRLDFQQGVECPVPNRPYLVRWFRSDGELLLGVSTNGGTQPDIPNGVFVFRADGERVAQLLVGRTSFDGFTADGGVRAFTVAELAGSLELVAVADDRDIHVMRLTV